MDNTEKLKPCPFCGGKAFLIVCDDEGNFKNEDYEQDAWSGLWYMLGHELKDNEDCPIAVRTDGDENIGVTMYGSRAEAIEAWNKRND